MPARAACPCTYPGCGALVRDGSHRCQKHPREPFANAPGNVVRTTGRRAVAMRREFLADNPLCAGPDSLCEREGRVSAAVIRDHRIPLAEGGTDDLENLQALCKTCHDIKSHAEAKRGVFREFDPDRRMTPETADRQMPDDLTPSRIPLVIVCGPHRHRHVKQNAVPGDLVIDIDRIITAMACGQAQRNRWTALALEARNDLLRGLQSDQEHARAWFILNEPDEVKRAMWARRLGGKIVTT